MCWLKLGAQAKGKRAPYDFDNLTMKSIFHFWHLFPGIQKSHYLSTACLGHKAILRIFQF